jgi:hypothetical protein
MWITWLKFGAKFALKWLSFQTQSTVSPVGLASTGLEHLHRCFIGVNHTVTQNLGFKCIHQRLQLHPAAAYPSTQRGARDGKAGTTKDGFLAVQRKRLANPP